MTWRILGVAEKNNEEHLDQEMLEEIQVNQVK